MIEQIQQPLLKALEKGKDQLDQAVDYLTKAHLLSGAAKIDARERSKVMVYTNEAMYLLGCEPRMDFSEDQRYTPAHIVELRKIAKTARDSLGSKIERLEAEMGHRQCA